MEEFAQGPAFVVAILDGQDTIAQHVCKCPTHGTIIIPNYRIINLPLLDIQYLEMLQGLGIV